jgi:hypothetical protein
LHEEQGKPDETQPPIFSHDCGGVYSSHINGNRQGTTTNDNTNLTGRMSARGSGHCAVNEDEVTSGSS